MTATEKKLLSLDYQLEFFLKSFGDKTTKEGEKK